MNCTDSNAATEDQQLAPVAVRKRCVIYTRDIGLTDPFDAPQYQRELCERYVAFRTNAGWETVATYSDGGRSRTPSKRAEYQRLLADVADRKVDVVIVDRVHRLVPSLQAIASLVEALDAAGCALVSVKQMLNTAEPGGRFILNMLVAFADFERQAEADYRRSRAEVSAR